VLDALGDHSHTQCPQPWAVTKGAHEHILSALEKNVKRGSFTTRRRNVTSSRGGQKGDLQIQNINFAGKTHLVIDVALAHDFSGDCCRDVSRNGKLRYADPDMLLNNAADVKSAEVPPPEAYAAPDRLLAFLLPCMCTSIPFFFPLPHVFHKPRFPSFDFGWSLLETRKAKLTPSFFVESQMCRRHSHLALDLRMILFSLLL